MKQDPYTCRYCGAPIRMIRENIKGHMVAVDQVPVHVHQLVGNAALKYQSYFLKDGTLIHGRLPEHGEHSIEAYIPHKRICAAEGKTNE